MISTVTTSTITTVTTMAAMGLTVAIGVAAVVSLVIFLTTKELASTTHSNSSLRVAKFINVGILPLAIAFGAILITKILEIVT